MNIYVDSSLGGDFGVVLTSCLIITGGIQYAMRQSAEMETWMISVERILEYGQLEREEDLEIETFNLAKTWPDSGTIEFQNVHLNYSQEGKSALDGLTFKVKAGEKVST